MASMSEAIEIDRHTFVHFYSLSTCIWAYTWRWSIGTISKKREGLGFYSWSLLHIKWRESWNDFAVSRAEVYWHSLSLSLSLALFPSISFSFLVLSWTPWEIELDRWGATWGDRLIVFGCCCCCCWCPFQVRLARRVCVCVFVNNLAKDIGSASSIMILLAYEDKERTRW